MNEPIDESNVSRSRSHSIGRSSSITRDGQTVTRTVGLTFGGETVEICRKLADGTWASPELVSVDQIDINEEGDPLWNGTVVRIASPGKASGEQTASQE